MLNLFQLVKITERTLFMYKIRLLFIDKDSCFEQFRPLEKYVSEERRNRIVRYKFDKDKILSLFASLFVRYDILSCTSLNNSEITFSNGKYGKPHLNCSDYPIHFSVSHTNGCIAYARHNKKCGIDVENIHPVHIEVAERFFSEDETEHIKNSSDPDSDFTRIWTQKEAYIKMLGTGLNTSLDSFSVMSEHIADSILTFNKQNYFISLCSEQKISENADISVVTIHDITEFFSKQ